MGPQPGEVLLLGVVGVISRPLLIICKISDIVSVDRSFALPPGVDLRFSRGDCAPACRARRRVWRARAGRDYDRPGKPVVAW